MYNTNVTRLTGRLGKDPEVKFLSSGTAAVNFSIAVSESWNDKSGQKKERTDWISIVGYGKLAEVAGQALRKGLLVTVDGKIRTRSYEKDGRKVYVTEVQADSISTSILNDSGGAKAAASAGEEDSDLPF